MTLTVSQCIEQIIESGQSDQSDHRIPIFVLLGSTPQRAFKELFDCLRPLEQAKIVAFLSELPQCEKPPSLRVIVVSTDELSQAQGCLCCAIGSELANSLSQLFFGLLRRQEPAVAAVVIVTEALDASALAQTLKHAPFLGQRYKLQGCLPLTDA